MPEYSIQPKALHFIDNDRDLASCLAALRQEEAIALDLEFDSHNHSYGVTLCLIQVATETACYVIDPMAHVELQPLWQLFEAESVQKIVHAPGEDLRLLHSLGCFPRNLFDTETVARLLNYEQTSISVLLQLKFGISLSKQQQRSNWLRRPLSPEQVRYAADDVTYLHALKAALVSEALPKGLMPFVAEEQQSLSNIVFKQETKDSFLKPADLHTLSPRDQYLLNGVYRYRDELARQHNKPAFHIMDDASVRALAAGTLKPASFPDDRNIHRVLKSEKAIQAFSTRLKALRSEALSMGLSAQLPRREYLTPEQHAAKEKASRDKTQKFQPIQKELANRMGLFAARFIFSNTLVSELLLHNTTLGGLKPYRAAMIRDIAAGLGIDLGEYEAQDAPGLQSGE